MTVTITFATENKELKSIFLNEIETIAHHGEVIIFIDAFGETYSYFYSDIIFSVH